MSGWDPTWVRTASRLGVGRMILEWRSNTGFIRPPKDYEEWRDAIKSVSDNLRVVISERGAGAWYLVLADEPSGALGMDQGARPIDRRPEVVAALRAAGKNLTND